MFFQILVQLFGLIGFILLVVSYWRKDIKELLVFQLFSGVFYALHYYFLGAYSGLFIILFELIRDFSYYKSDLDKYIFLATIPVYAVGGFLSFSGFISLFPTFASVIDGYGLANNKTSAVLLAILSNVLWLVYDFSAHSYSGIVTGIIIIVSNIIVFISDKKICRKVN